MSERAGEVQIHLASGAALRLAGPACGGSLADSSGSSLASGGVGPGIDLGQLAELFRAVGFLRPGDPGHLAEMLAGSRWVVSARDGDRLVGFARAISDGVSNAYVTSVAVLPSHQRRGIGRRMLEALLEGRPGVKWVLHASEVGEGLYRSLGFREVPRMMMRDRTAPAGTTRR